MLTEAEVGHYRDRGYAVPANYRVPDAALAGMRRDLDRLIEANPHVSPDAMFCPHEPDHGTQGLKGDRVWLEHAGTPEILDMVEQVIGGDFLLWGTTVFGKPAHSGKETPWHQDGEYWPIRPLATCSVWIALDAATPENGCLRVIPGSHRDRRLRRHRTNDGGHLTLNQQLEADEYSEADAVDIVLAPGQISLHDIYMVHGSRPNRSPRRRAGYVLRFMPTTSHFDRQLGAEIAKRTGGAVDFATRPLYLMRGRDVCGRNELAERSPA
ncbi:phytanoyl-CoA dioxygenase family protein [Minwuia thermotolerans]|uniref:Phytanoyl-CoA dioxygenase n=1 Tax=Minwuia thermotolerans TaxID=2056226 RepID=A0A2M9G5L6_9PROT|nr:phytanoyl-CoA dioxygenase family protein [Minwuia thermotolerans]PJK30994.1 phytanoyl-CoA dioxygenase [Minwuia thermotolerans]